ncbi:hypothetical protein HDU96_007961 [Phlyctochytrium bullatum]|nr:hypothetical protein HDU96_007961 [Phlyctochytrium bullatum]
MLDLREFYDGHPPIAVMKRYLPQYQTMEWEDFRLPPRITPVESSKGDKKKGVIQNTNTKNGTITNSKSEKSSDTGGQLAVEDKTPSRGKLDGLEPAEKLSNLTEPNAAEPANAKLSKRWALPPSSKDDEPEVVDTWYTARNAKLPQRLFIASQADGIDMTGLLSYRIMQSGAGVQRVIRFGRPFGSSSDPVAFECLDLLAPSPDDPDTPAIEFELASLSLDPEDTYGLPGAARTPPNSNISTSDHSFPSLSKLGVPKDLPSLLFHSFFREESHKQRQRFGEQDMRRRTSQLAFVIICLTVLPLSIGVCWLIGYRLFLRTSTDAAPAQSWTSRFSAASRMRYKLYKSLKGGQ